MDSRLQEPMFSEVDRLKYFYARCADEDSADEEFAYAKERGFENSQIYIDKSSGKNAKRPNLSLMRSRLQRGDEVFVTELSRLAKSTRELLDLVREFDSGRVNFHSEKEEIDTTAPNGELVFHIFDSIAKFQKQIKLENAAEGRAAVKAQGKRAGRPKVDQDALDLALHMFQFDLEKSIPEICRKTGISRSTLYRVAEERGVQRASHLRDTHELTFDRYGSVKIEPRNE